MKTEEAGDIVLRAQTAPRKKTGPVETVCWRCEEKGHKRDDFTERHSMGKADGKRTVRMVKGRGDAQVCLKQ